jgi:hypothetical protein
MKKIIMIRKRIYSTNKREERKTITKALKKRRKKW